MIFVRTVIGAFATLYFISLGVVVFGQRNTDADRDYETRLNVVRLVSRVDEHERRLSTIESHPPVDVQIARLTSEVEGLKGWMQFAGFGLGGAAMGGGALVVRRRPKREPEIE